MASLLHARSTALSIRVTNTASAAAGQPNSSRAAGVSVLGAWALASVAAFAFVATFARNCPWADEWVMVPQLAGREPVTLSWLWSAHNEHRLPLPRLVLVGLYRVTHDFRAGPFLNVGLLS